MSDDSLEQLCQLLVLRLTARNAMPTSVYFNRLFTGVGYFANPTLLIDEMESEGLITHEGRFEGTSGLIKNIRCTERGLDAYSREVRNVVIPDDISPQTMEFIKKIFQD